MRAAICGALIALVSFWSGFITAALFRAGKDDSNGK